MIKETAVCVCMAWRDIPKVETAVIQQLGSVVRSSIRYHTRTAVYVFGAVRVLPQVQYLVSSPPSALSRSIVTGCCGVVYWCGGVDVRSVWGW